MVNSRVFVVALAALALLASGLAALTEAEADACMARLDGLTATERMGKLSHAWNRLTKAQRVFVLREVSLAEQGAWPGGAGSLSRDRAHAARARRAGGRHDARPPRQL